MEIGKPTSLVTEVLADQQEANESNGNESAVDAKSAKSKVDKRKQKKQKNKENKQLRRQQQAAKASSTPAASIDSKDSEDIVIEYVSAPIDLDVFESEPAAPEPEEPEFGGLGLGGGSGLGFGGLGLGMDMTEPSEPKNPYAEFKQIFQKFLTPEEMAAGPNEDEDEPQAPQEKEKEKEKEAAKAEDSDSDDEEGGDGKKKLSKKQLKMLHRVRISELKQVCERPDVVEVWDVTAPEPETLVFLKAYRNTVAIPRHWSQKRKYLQGKRGLEKPPFKLPDYIEATGIGEMRQAYQEKEEAKKQKQKLREKARPKTGRMDIDYQILHDAFFKYQTKPPLTRLGDIYYEGKEFEAAVKNVKPGVLSDDLRKALGMTDGAPPPWLINMQRYGPPPSYPSLKVAGLNAPIPPGASFGYHPGGWGKPPVDEEGNPLYGDVFGQYETGADSDEEVDIGTRWGELEVEAEESEEEEEDQDEDAGLQDDEMAAGIASGIVSGMASGMVSGLTSGIASSLPSGIETPEMVNLRKGGEEARPLYQVLQQKAVPLSNATLMGTDHVYVMPTDPTKAGAKRKFDVLKGIPSDVEVTLNPEELEGLDEAAIKQLYDEKVAEQKASNRQEDFSDLVAAKAAQQKRKLMQKQDQQSNKKAKDFKF